MPQYASVFDFTAVDGTNGFRIDGLAAGDSLGSGTSAGDVNGDGIGDLLLSAPGGDPNSVSNSGQFYVVFGQTGGFGSTFDLTTLDGHNGFAVNGISSNAFPVGFSISAAGDVNGDTFGDFIIGAKNDGASAGGQSYLVFGKHGGFHDLNLVDLNGVKGVRFDGPSGTLTGISVSSAGDVNGDGFDDVLIGDYADDPGGNSHNGASYIVFGKADWSGDATFDLATLDGSNGFRVTGLPEYNSNGTHVAAAGDINGDGFADVMIGTESATTTVNPALTNYSGATYVVLGKADWSATPSVDISALDGSNGFSVSGLNAYDLGGYSVSAGGDIDGDGFGDFIIGTPGFEFGDYTGASYVVFGKASWVGEASVDLSALDGSNGFRVDGEKGNDLTGISVSGVGDWNGDGFSDFVLSSWRGNGDADGDKGDMYVVFGKPDWSSDATLDVTTLDGDNGFRIDGTSTASIASLTASGIGDINDDGFDDILIADPTNGNGASFVVYGAAPGEAVVRNGTATGNTIHGGDLDDKLSGLNGNDFLFGLGGQDVIKGGTDKDTLHGGDGNDKLAASGGKDLLFGDAGADKLTGGGGADTLDGGADADTFIYASASESTGKNFDIIKHIDFTADVFDLTTAISGVDATISTGALSKNSFDANLAAAADSGHLGAGHAVLFTPNSGSLAGKIFLVIDVNGTAGYQSGAGGDLVVQLGQSVNLSIGTEDFT